VTARAVPTLPTWVSGTVVTQAQMLQLNVWDQFWANPPMFRMYQTVAQSIPNATLTQIACDTPDYDSDSGRASSTPWSYTIPVGMTGTWKLWLKDSFPANATGVRVVQAYRNGAGIATIQKFSTPNSAFAMQPVISDEVDLNAGDVMSIWGYQSTGSAVNTDVSTGAVFGGRLVSLANP
jgi:hypothetical protein